jgi:hypothetical protein
MKYHDVECKVRPADFNTIISLISDSVESLECNEITEGNQPNTPTRIKFTVDQKMLLTVMSTIANDVVSFRCHPTENNIKRTRRRAKGIKSKDFVLTILEHGSKSQEFIMNRFGERGFSANTCYSALHTLSEEGKIERDARGKWSVTEQTFSKDAATPL